VFSDPFNPLTYIVLADLSKADVDAFHALRDAAGKRVDPFAADFGQAYRGRHLSLSGALLVPAWHAPLQAVLGWPGARLSLEGKPLGKEPLKLDSYGFVPLNLELTVPADASGPLPLTLTMEGRDLAAEGRINGMDLSHGFRSEYFSGDAPVKGEKPAAHRYEPASTYRFYDNTFFSSPFRARWRAQFTAPAAGEYRFSLPRSRAAIKVGGREVFRSVDLVSKPQQLPVRLAKGQSASFELEAILAGGAQERTLALQVQGPGDATPVWADSAWFKSGL
jgi:hypothetical protein